MIVIFDEKCYLAGFEFLPLGITHGRSPHRSGTYVIDILQGRRWRKGRKEPE